jgi:hypothetical protein
MTCMIFLIARLKMVIGTAKMFLFVICLTKLGIDIYANTGSETTHITATMDGVVDF